MRNWPVFLGTVVALSACANSRTATVPIDSARSALAAYYATIDKADLPRLENQAALPTPQTTLSRIIIASCIDEEVTGTSDVLQRMAQSNADLALLIGDNVYGDRDGPAYINNDPDLMELRESYEDLAKRTDFQALAQRVPTMVAWDDHDYGANDAGSDFAFKALSERIHETFWGLDQTEVADRPGTYYARTFGPEGQRTQIIMLDTRFFRSGLTPTDEWGAPGKERYIPSTAADQQMLGQAQWDWLEAQLSAPADLRLIVSSIQVVPTDGHGYEAWATLPNQQSKLYETIEQADARGVVFVSGDRHTAFLYRKENVLSYPVYEITASSVNVSFSDESLEQDSAQIETGYSRENFGALDIDWDNRTVRLSIHDEDGSSVRTASTKF